MRLRLGFAILRSTVAAALLGGGVAASAQDSDLVIADVTVVSPERDAPLEHAYVRIADGRIAEVSETPLARAEAIDGAGRVLIPGLIDSHTHLAGIPGMSREHEAEHPDIAAAARAQIPRSYLYFGFTTVLDIAGSADLTASWNSLEDRPDVYFCGPAPVAGGYSFRGLDGSPYFIYRPLQTFRLPRSVNRAEHQPEAVVDRMAADGAICVKTYYEPGFGEQSGQLPTPTKGMIRSLTAAAHERNMPVFVHANSLEAHRFVLAVGADAAAHGIWNGLPEGDALGAEAEAVVDEIAERGVGFQPTEQVIAGMSDLFDDDLLAREDMARAVPAALLAWYGTEEAGDFRRQLRRNFGDADPKAVLADVMSQGERVVARLAQRDARLLFGTDTPSDDTYANPAGLNGLWEMRDWIDAGVSEAQLFRAATIENARILRLDDEIGTVEEGKVANLLLLDANPLDDVEAYDTIETVFLHGRPIAREELSAHNAPAP